MHSDIDTELYTEVGVLIKRAVVFRILFMDAESDWSFLKDAPVRLTDIKTLPHSHTLLDSVIQCYGRFSSDVIVIHRFKNETCKKRSYQL